jgi:CarboxypepD_reg-like domain
MKKLSFIIFLFSIFSFSQNIKLEGFIQDNTKLGLEMANVMAINQASKAMDAYAITNDKGKFALNLKPNTTYNIKVSYLGMQSKEVVIATKAENISQNIILENSENQLNEVEVVREMPVSIKGDTIVYNADSFKTGTERKLEDVLKKLPGVVVNKDGEIEVEGKKVTKLMVEGKDFFDGDTKLGVKNIPADAIDKIQVLKNYNEVDAMKGLGNDQDNIAMNIKLKAGKKNFWFGDITAGIGVVREESRYVVNPKLFYYNPKYSLNLITNFNNIGELPLTVQDYFKFTGGFKNMMKKGGSNFNLSSNDLGISLLRNNRAKEIETQFGATNFVYNITKKFSLSGFSILTSSKTDLENFSQSTILKTGVKQKNDEKSIQNNKLGLFKISATFKPNNKLQIDYDVLSKISRQDEQSNSFREIIFNNLNSKEDIFSLKKQNPNSVNQNLNLYYTKNDKNIFAVELQHLYQDENPFFNANLQNQAFNLSGIVAGQNRNNLNQNRFVKTNKIDAKLDYYYMVTPKSNINLTFGNTNSNQTFNSNIYQILDNGFSNDLSNPENNNRVKYSFNDAFLGLHYKILTGKFTFTPGLNFHTFNTTNTQLGSNYKLNFTRLLPDFFALYQIKKSETLTYTFALNNDFTDINQLASGFILSNLNNLFQGNRELENATSQVHSLRFFKYNMFNFENIFANATYSRKVDAVKTNANFVGINQSSKPFNSNFADENLFGSASYQRSFYKYYKASANVNLNWSKFNNIQNNLPVVVESFTQSYQVKMSTNFKKYPNLELGFEKQINKYSGQTFFTDSPSINLDYYFLDSFSFVAEYEYNNYYNSDKSVNNSFDVLTSSLIFQKKNSKFEYKISGTNLLNTTSLNDDNFTQFATRTSQYAVQPRYVIFSLKYDL